MPSSLQFDCLGSEGVHILATRLLLCPKLLSFSCLQDRECPTKGNIPGILQVVSWIPEMNENINSAFPAN